MYPIALIKGYIIIQWLGDKPGGLDPPSGRSGLCPLKDALKPRPKQVSLTVKLQPSLRSLPLNVNLEHPKIPGKI